MDTPVIIFRLKDVKILAVYAAVNKEMGFKKQCNMI